MSVYEDFDFEQDENFEFNFWLNKLIDFEVERRARENDTENKIETLENKIKNLNSIITQLRSENKRIQELEDNIYKLENKNKELLNSNIQNWLEEKLNGIKSYDTVFTIKHTSYFHEPCVTCGQKGKIKAIIGGKEQLIDCPDCKGSGKIQNENSGRFKYYIEKEKVIFAISSDFKIVTFYQRYDGGWNKLNEAYYKTEAEAQKKVDEYNERNKIKELNNTNLS